MAEAAGLTERATGSEKSEQLHLLFASFFGAGRSPFAPGTAGSLAALPLAALAAASAPAGLALAAVIAALGVKSAGVAARKLGRTDPGFVVIDEVAGMIISAAGIGLTARGLLSAFLLFRLFDIVKPPPCRDLEKLPGGWGIMADDIAAGIYARGTLEVLRRFARF